MWKELVSYMPQHDELQIPSKLPFKWVFIFSISQYSKQICIKKKLLGIDDPN